MAVSKILHIIFEYADEKSGWKQRRQKCDIPSVEECIRFYGLGKDCKYKNCFH